VAPEVIQKAHEKYDGCGGFFVHETLEEAKEWAHGRRLMASFNPPTGPGAGDKKLPLAEESAAKLKASDFIDFIKEYTTTFKERYSKASSGLRASNWLAKRWSGYAEGISWAKVEEVPVRGYQQNNVVMTLTGRNAEKRIVVGAHMDSTKGDKPAADDNASGTSVVNALAQLALKTNLQPENTIIFVLYAAEETGLNGSKQMAQEFKSSKKEVMAVVNFDMVGSAKNKKGDITWISNNVDTKLNDWLKKLVTLYFPDLKQTSKKITGGSSDHASWHKSGFSASWPFESGGDRVIHTAQDTWDRLDGEHITNLARVGVLFFVHMAMADVVPTTTTPIPGTDPPGGTTTPIPAGTDGLPGSPGTSETSSLPWPIIAGILLCLICVAVSYKYFNAPKKPITTVESDHQHRMMVHKRRNTKNRSSSRKQMSTKKRRRRV